MAHFYFHLRNGHDVLMDPEGRELADLDAARRLALDEARALISGDALAGAIHMDQRIDVTDGHEAILHSLEFRDAVKVTGWLL